MNLDIVRAWKDEDYRHCLSGEELLSLPENPVGEIELADEELEAVYGGRRRNGHQVENNSNVCHNNSGLCSGGCISNGCVVYSGGCVIIIEGHHR